MAVTTAKRPSRKHPASVYRRRRTAAAGAMAVALLLLVHALAGGGRAPRSHQLRVSDENRAAIDAARPLADGLDRLLLGAPLPSSAEQQAAIGRLMSLALPMFCAGTQHKYVALTFDDGPGAQTERVLGLLAHYDQRATFFLLGRQLVEQPDLPAVEARAAAIGDHTISHFDLTKLSPQQVESELGATRQLLERAAGAPVRLFRPPYGAHNPVVDATAQRLGLLQVIWNVDTQDAEGATAAQIVQRAREGMRPGAIILLHENRLATLAALPRILRSLRKGGYRSVTVPELFALNPPSDEQVRAGFKGCVDAERTGSRALRPTGAA
jgi:peptidoglycan/xylan/chitin deacetylase (PgdA/CDA1 family)